MQKPTFKNKSFTRKQAFTLIELLIVISIIGILFIVLVSKVDFATDKAKATGVQTDFRSFQMAFDTVAKENAGFNTFGWDTGDANQNGKRDSYDEGDNGAGGGIAQNGIQDGAEVFTGHKVYSETFTKVYSLKKNGTGAYDRDALNRLETAINANLDPKLHITIKDDGEIVMANGAKDPWNKEYHGWYITNAEADKKDRGAIIMYSDGANNAFGSEHTIANGVVSISIPGNNKYGKDDYALVSVYTYFNGYGEVLNVTAGFSNNQTMLGNNGNGGYNSNESNEENNNQSQQVHELGFKYNTIYHMPLNGDMATREGSAMGMMFNENGTCTWYGLMMNNNKIMGVTDMELAAELLNSKNGGTYTVDPTLSTVTVKSTDGTTYEKNLYKIYMQLDFELFGSDLWSAEIAYDPIEDIFYGAVGDAYGDTLNLTEQIDVNSTKSIQFNKEYRYIGENNAETLTILFKESGEMYLNGVLAASNIHYKDQLVYNDDLSIMICVSFDGQYIVHESDYYKCE